MPRKRTYGLDADTIAYAARVKAGSGVAILPEPLKQLNKFIAGIKKLGLWNSMVCWPMRSVHNAGRGSTVYSLGGLGIFNGSNAGVWSSRGVSGANFNTLTYVPNNFNGTMCIVAGLLNSTNQRIIGHNANVGGWATGTQSDNSSWWSYFDTIKGGVGYGGSSGSFNNRGTISFGGFSRNLSGNTTTYISNPNTANAYYGTSTATLTGLTTATSFTYVAAGINCFFIHLNNINFQQSDYKALETLLRNTLFKDNTFQWVY
jgi:hypothetical protein